MANGAFNEQGVQFVWDSSSLKLADTCMRKYYYQMIEGWQPRGSGVHLKFGQHYATALEHYFKLVAQGQDPEDALRAVVLEALTDTWERPECETCGGSGVIKDTSPPEDPTVTELVCHACHGTGKASTGGAPWESHHNFKTRETLIRTIVWYFDHFENDPAPVVILSDGAPAVEHTFKLPVDNGIIFSGHIDRLVEYSGQILVMDQKTTGSTLSPYYFEQYSPDTQMSMYSFAARAVFNEPVKGVIIDAAQIAVGFSRFQRGFAFRTDQVLDEWYDMTMRLIEDTQRKTLAQQFDMRTQSCGNYGGCAFRSVCARSPEVRPQFLKADFEQGPTWDPSIRR
jgi:hypothetical protein